MKTRTAQQKNQKHIALGMLLVAGVLFALYVYFICASIMHVVAREEVQKAMAQHRSHLSALESDYIAAQHAVSEDVAYLDGYEATHTKVFIDRTEPSLVLNTITP